MQRGSRNSWLVHPSSFILHPFYAGSSAFAELARGRKVSGHKTWGGRFSGETDNRVEAFTESISFDRRLYREDILASQAHARMLAEVGLLSGDEARQIVSALDDVKDQIDRG